MSSASLVSDWPTRAPISVPTKSPPYISCDTCISFTTARPTSTMANAVNYEVLDFNPPTSASPTSPSSPNSRRTTPKRAVIAVVFSQTGPLAQADWKPILTQVTHTLQEELGQRRSLAQPPRFLDLPSTASSPDTTPCRVAEITVPLASNTALPTLAQCSQISKSAATASLCARHGIELVLQPQDLYALHRAPGLAVFDMDSTLIQQEVIDELARAVGRYEQVAAITEAAMRGEAPYTDFEASLRARVGLLKGVPTGIWEELRTGVIRFTPGARELVRVLKGAGWKCAVLSGGFTPLAEWVRRELGLDYAFANHLVEEGGVLTGELVEGMPIIHAEKKRELLGWIAEKEGIPLERVIAVGDGSNDLKMMERAGLGIAFNAKPKVQMLAPAKINCAELTDVTYVLGYTKDEVDEILRPEMVLQDGQYVLRRLQPDEPLPVA